MRHRGERGSISVWMVTASVVMMILVGLAVDLGGQVHTQQRARNLAAQAARVGGQHVQPAPAVRGQYVAVNTAPARAAAQRYLATTGISGTVTVTGGDTLTVKVHDTYQPKFLLFLGIDQLDVTGTASARLIRSFGGNEE